MESSQWAQQRIEGLYVDPVGPGSSILEEARTANTGAGSTKGRGMGAVARHSPTAEARTEHTIDSTPGLYLVVEDVAERLHCSRRTVHELTRTSSIPHRRLPGSRRCLFRRDELEAWENGWPLEVTTLPRGGPVVTPRLPTR